ncbi:MAG TPA: tRNA pseudouridine(38-40) synthase TruA [Actinomycetota bacterium]|nr:tRNA pseudouridine(38-40) synthase TruA [Actinomycetota bacterium]
MTIRMLLAYDGTDFHGWARQPGVRTIEGTLEDALARLLPGVPPLSVAGRTDAGVHAEGQVASFAAQDDLEPERVQRMLNGMFAPEVVVLRATRAREDFDARHSATGREYRYRIDTSELPSPFTARFVWHHPAALSLGRMRAAARLLEGEHDFSSFCRAPQARASTVRFLRRLAISASTGRVEIRALANGFLHQMVRSLVGTLVAVGEGKIEPDSMPKILEARSRAAAGPVAPPHGLTLVRVEYGRS